MFKITDVINPRAIILLALNLSPSCPFINCPTAYASNRLVATIPTSVFEKPNSSCITGIATESVTSTLDWFDQQTITLNASSTVKWNALSNRPTTTEYAAARGSRFDELHVVIIDAQGSITGEPNRAMPPVDAREIPAIWGNGIKLGYDEDNVSHQVIRCLTWNNNGAGFHMNLGPSYIVNSVSFGNTCIKSFIIPSKFSLNLLTKSIILVL